MTLKPQNLAGLEAAAGQTALDEPLSATLDRWQKESSQLARAGIYDWLTSRISGQRILEIGCGFGASTAALVRAGKTVMALDNRMDCLESTQQRVPEATYGLADIHHYDERLLDDLCEFAPDAVVCWLAGAPADSLPRDVPAAYAVMQHRLLMEQAVVRLAARLDTVQTVHLADRTAFPWKMKDAGRQTMARMIGTAVCADSPFSLTEADIQFRRIEALLSAATTATSVGKALLGVVPVIGEATLMRSSNRRHNSS